MAENHKLRLEIDASKARAGKNQFVGALEAISRAVLKLERDGSGAFTSLIKNSAKASAAIKSTKFKGVDARVTKGLESFANAQLAAYKAALKSKRNVNSLIESLTVLSGSYMKARGSSDLFTKSIWSANTALGKQFELASKVAAAQNASRGVSTKRVSAVKTTSSPALVDQAKLQKAIATTETSVERLSTSFLRLGAFSSMQKIGSAFREFNKIASKSNLSAEDFSKAVTKMAVSTKRSQTSLVTLTAKAREESRALRETTKAFNAAAKAARTSAKAQLDDAKAIEAQTRRAEKQKTVQLAAAGAMRKAAGEAQRMAISLRKIGDTKGVASVTSALATLQKRLSATAITTLQMKEATNAFGAVTSKTKEHLTSYAAKQREAATSSAELAKEARNVATAAARADQQIRRNAATARAASGSWNKASGSMRGLENSMSSTFQIGSALRVMFGSLTLGSFITSVYAAGTALEQFNVTMEIATGSAGGAAAEIDNLDAMSRKFGTDLRGAREDFSKFAVASSLAGVSMGETRKIFESVSMAMSVMGRGAEDQRLAFLALEQMMSKGTISSEELRRQLGERLPGAVNLMAKAVGVTTGELQKLLKAGALASSDVLPKFADELNKAFGPGLEAATKRASFNIGTAKVELEKLLSSIGESGFMRSVAKGFNELTRVLQKPAIRVALEKLGENLAMLAEGAIEFGITLVDNMETVAKVANAVFNGLLASTLAKLAASFVTSLAVSGTAVSGLITWFVGLGAAKTADNVITTESMAVAALADLAKGKSAAATAALTATTIAGTEATVAQAGANTLLGRSMLGLGSGIAKTATGMAALAKFASSVALPLALITAGVILFKKATSDSSSAAEDMAKSVEGAMRRAGVSFDEFAQSAVQAASTIRVNNLLRDMSLIEGSLSSVGETADANFSLMASAYRAALDGMSKQEFFIGDTFKDAGAVGGFEAIAAMQDKVDTVGIAVFELFKNLSSPAKKAASDLIDVADAASTTVGGYNALRDAAARTIQLFPSLEGFAVSLAAGTEELALQEIALNRHSKQLVDLYGTPNDKLVRSFADMAVQVIALDGGLDDLIERQRVLSQESPEIAQRTLDVVDATIEAIKTGASPFTLELNLQGNFDAQAVKYRELRAAIATTDEAANAAFSSARVVAEQWSAALDAGTLSADGQVGAIVELAAKLVSFEDSAVSVDKLSVAYDTLNPPEEALRGFTEAAIEQFKALPEGQRTYATLVEIMRSLNDTVSDTAGLTEYSSALLSTVAPGQAAALTAQQVLSEVENLKGGSFSLSATFLSMLPILEDLAWDMSETEDATKDAHREISQFEAAARGAASSADSFAGSAGRLRAALHSLAGAGSAAIASAQDVLNGVNRRIEIGAMNAGDAAAARFNDSTGQEVMAEAIKTTNAAYLVQVAAAAELGISSEVMIAQAGRQRDESLATTQAILDQAAAQEAVLALQNESSGGGGGSAKDLSALEELTKATKEQIASLKGENIALAALAEGYARTSAGADYMAAAMMAGKTATEVQTDALFMQAEAAALLNEELTKLANDPVNDWMKSVPNWVDAGQQIETDVIGSLSSAISGFIQTGKIDFQSLGESILGSIADIVADKAMKEFVALLGGNTSGTGEGGFGLGGILGNLFSSQGDTGLTPESGAGNSSATAMEAALQTGGAQAAQAMHDAMTSAATTIAGSMQTGGQQAANSVLQAHATGGAQVGTSITTSMHTGATRNRAAITGASASGSQNLKRGVEQGSRTGAGLMANAISSASGGGGGGGGILGSIMGLIGGEIGGGLGEILSIIPFKNGGVTSSPSYMNNPVSATAASFSGAPSYAKGTPNTSGIPAVLHENEAVVPLSGGRKIPVDIGNMPTGQTVINQTFNINTPDADSFRKSQPQIAMDMSAAAQESTSLNG